MTAGSYPFSCICFTDIETNECLQNNGGCWQDKAANITACQVCNHLAPECLLEKFLVFFSDFDKLLVAYFSREGV